MRQFWAALLLFPAIGLAQSASLPSVSRGGTSYIALPPVLLLNQTVRRVEIAPNSQWLICEQALGAEGLNQALADLGGGPFQATVAPRLLFVNPTTGQMLPLQLPADLLSWQMTWSVRPGRGVLRLTTRGPGSGVMHTLYPFSNGLGRPLQITQKDGGEDLTLYPSPIEPVILALGQSVEFGPDGIPSRETWHLHRISDEGVLAQSQNHARESSGPRGVLWDSSGKVAFLRVTRNNGSAALARIELDQLDLSLVSPALIVPASDDRVVSLVSSPVGWKLKGESGESEVVAPIGSQAVLSGDGKSLAYIFEGVLFLRSIFPAPISKLAAAQYAQARGEAERQGRDVGRALRLFWRDNFMNFPAKASAKQLLDPYLRDARSVENLEVEFAGGPVTKGLDTTSVAFGVIRTKYGRVVIRLDGTLLWFEGSQK